MAGVLIGQHQHAVQHPIGQVSQSPIGQSLYNESGDEIALIVGLERKKSHKVLPFTYLRVSYYGESVPSGTMLFNEKGEVVAFQYVRHDQHETQAYAVPVQAVERAHQDFVTNNFISRCWVGMIVSSSGTVPEIASIRPNSPASKAGLKKGDILAKVGDYTITSYHEAVNAFYYLVAGQTETFEVFRDGELITVELVPVPKNSL